MEPAKLSNFYVRSGIFTLLSLAGAVFNYSLYPILAHLLNARQFGNFTVVLALSNQILAILIAFNVTSISLVKNNPEAVAREKAQAIQKALIWFFMAVSLITLLLSPLLKTKLKVDEPAAFFVLALLLLVSVPVVVWNGYLQGHKRLINVGIFNFSSSLLRLLLAVLLGASFGTLGALWGTLAGLTAGILILRFSTNIKLPNIKTVVAKLSPGERLYLKELRFFIIQSIFIVGGLGFLQNIDIVYAKVFFDPQVAGVYSGVSILSNAIYYVSFLLIWIILPEISLNDKQTNRRVLGSAYKLLSIMAVGLIFIEVMLRSILTKVLLGSQFAYQGQVLIFATLFQITLIAVTLYAFYLLVLKDLRSLVLAASVIFPCAILPWFFRHDPRQMIISIWSSVLIGITIYCIINIRLRGNAR